jgi:hypothetical protein
MHEFLSEFRSARNEFLDPSCESITKMELAEIVDRVNLPLPDVRILAELFEEMASPQTGRVKFEAFLARMNYKIQGRYPIDIIRSVYYSLTAGTDAAQPWTGDAWIAEQCTTQNDLAASTAAQVLASAAPEPVMDTPTSPSLSQMHGSVPGGSALVLDTMASFSPAVPKLRCWQEGLVDGLGIRVSYAEFHRALQSLNMPWDDETFELNTSDFVAVVHAVCGQSREDDL